MKNTTPYKLLFSFFLFCQFGFAQVDVVYSDLVWSDEFNSSGPVDSNKWHHQTQLPSGGSWYNGELQHYTNLLSNSYVNAGLLNIVAKNESYTNQGELYFSLRNFEKSLLAFLNALKIYSSPQLYLQLGLVYLPDGLGY